jgi:hypothetical protein
VVAVAVVIVVLRVLVVLAVVVLVAQIAEVQSQAQPILVAEAEVAEVAVRQPQAALVL